MSQFMLGTAAAFALIWALAFPVHAAVQRWIGRVETAFGIR